MSECPVGVLATTNLRSLMDDMLECSVDTFLAHYSPFSPSDALFEAAKQALISAELLVLNEKGEPKEWQHFSDGWSKDSKEDVVFKPLEAIANVFDNSLQGLNGREHRFSYRDCPHTVVTSEIPGSYFKLDASFVGNINHAKSYYVTCSEIAVVIEFTKSAQDFIDNRKRLMSAASHIMNDDPCRKWIYGITIENSKMAVWYFSRSHSVKSEVFPFTMDIDTFIRVFLSFIYATRDEIGYDPTVHRISDDRLRYVYKIPHETSPRYFKTTALLSHRRVLCITGRKTRVWRAVEVKGLGDEMKVELNAGKEVALKDVWLDEGSRTEKQNLDDIVEGLGTVKEDAYTTWAFPSLQNKIRDAVKKDGYKKYFMDIVCDSFDFGRSKETSDHATPAPGILEFTETNFINEDPNMLEGSTQKARYSPMPRSQNDINILKTPIRKRVRSYETKVQYHLVYEEVGESVDFVGMLETAFSALSDAYIALILMYLAGWVHRDISAGNIIAVVQSDGRPGGKLSDLEFAKRCDDESGSSDPKIGTAFFMPVEIHLGKAYKANTDTEPARHVFAHAYDVDPNADDVPIDQSLLLPRPRPKAPRKPALRYRPQHGAESIWWVAFYILIYRVKYKDENAEEFANIIFTHTSLPTLARQTLFEDYGAVLEVLEKYLEPKLLLPAITNYMNEIPSLIYRTYFMDQPLDPEAMVQLFRNVYACLSRVIITVKAVKDVTLRPAHRAHLQKKRPRSETLSNSRADECNEEEVRQEPSLNAEMPQRKKRFNANAPVRG